MLIPGTTIQHYGARILGAGRGACHVCDQDVTLTYRRTGPYPKPALARVHGPRAARCPGSSQPVRPFWLGAHLPAWDELTDHDKGQALQFTWKVHWERSLAYARSNYPPVFEHPQLQALANFAHPEDESFDGDYYTAKYATSVVASLGEPLPSVPNPWAGTGSFLRREPATIPEPTYFLAARILGDDECQRLMEAADA